jgi:hypothetical protein
LAGPRGGPVLPVNTGKKQEGIPLAQPASSLFFLLSTGKIQATAGVALIPAPAAMVKAPVRIF